MCFAVGDSADMLSCDLVHKREARIRKKRLAEFFFFSFFFYMSLKNVLCGKIFETTEKSWKTNLLAEHFRGSHWTIRRIHIFQGTNQNVPLPVL